MNSKKSETLSASKNWFAVTTHARKEDLARANLEIQGYFVLCPSMSLRKRRRGNWQVVVEPMFPGYLFVSLKVGEDDFSPIRSTVGCKGLVRFGLKPLPVPLSVIMPLIELGDRPIETRPELVPGDRVRFEEGPFQGLEAVCALSKGQDRVKVLLNILGRSNEFLADKKNLSKLE